MEKFLLVAAVLGAISFLRSKMGDESYEKTVIAFIKWAFIILGALFAARVFYVQFVR